MGIDSHPKIQSLGSRDVRDILDGPVSVQEKIDGSQFNFGVVDGKLHMRSRRSSVQPGQGGMFEAAAKTAVSLYEDGLLRDSHVYRGEAMRGPKHNVLAYERQPPGGVILWDIMNMETGEYATHSFVFAEAVELGVMAVPELDSGSFKAEDLEEFMDLQSALGGAKIEGVVLKPLPGPRDGAFFERPLVAKFVSERFREKMGAPKKSKKPDPVGDIISQLATEARWEKARQRMAEEGILLGEPRDIGTLVRYVFEDVEAEEEDWIRDQLWEAYRKHILKGTANGLAQWYKRTLREEAVA